MLTLDSLRAELRRVTFKPGYRFSLAPTNYGDVKLSVIAEVPDVEHPGRTTVLRAPAVVPPMAHATAFHHWLKWHLGRVEHGEVDRFYRVDGQPFDDPHAPDANE